MAKNNSRINHKRAGGVLSQGGSHVVHEVDANNFTVLFNKKINWDETKLIPCSNVKGEWLSANCFFITAHTHVKYKMRWGICVELCHI